MNAQEIFQALRSGAMDPAAAEDALRGLLAAGGRPPRDPAGPAAGGLGPVPAQAPPAAPAGTGTVHWHQAAPGVALVAMEDREGRNAFSEALLAGLEQAFREIRADESCRVVVLTGYDGYFASGGTREGLLAIQEGRVRFTDIDVYTIALDCPLPVVAAMQGHAIGAGWAMGMFCDLAVLASESYYSSNYMKYGFTPGAGATLVFPERFGPALAREILFTGRRYRGAELAARGAPFPVVPRGEVLPTALALAEELAQAPREALIGLKDLLAVPVREAVAGTLGRERDMHERTFVDRAEVRERIAAAFDAAGPQRAALPAAPAAAPSRPAAPEPGRAAPPPHSSTAIAVIGMAGQFPGAADLDSYWDNLVSGRDCVSEVPESRWSQAGHYDPDPRTPGRTHSRWMGVLEQADAFDPLFFHISPAEAEYMDPQQRVFLTNAWHCVEDAGIAPSSLAGSRCGVFVGCGPSDYGQFLMNEGENAQGFTGASCAILGSRIAYFLNLKGPCLSIDTSCSSSGVALAAACDSLVLGTSDLALAGGVCVLSGPSTHVMASKAGMLSADGRCFTFDNRANGFVPGEGVGVLLLKRLDDAVRDGDPIRGVIRGWGVNQDGRTNGITAPSGSSQTRLLKDVYDRFGIDPESITMVEAHGTGTKLGDPIEVEALCDAFRGYTGKERFCSLGSVKSSVGHLLTAAGAAGVVKVLLAMEHGVRPPAVHLTAVNEHIDIRRSPFYLNTAPEPWTVPDGRPRRAAVSSFGFSGTNAHLVLEEYLPPRPEAPAEPGRPVLLPLSAQTDEQLRRYAAAVRRTVRNTPSLRLAELAYTLQTGRDPMERRLALVAASREDLLRQLDDHLAGSPPRPPAQAGAPPELTSAAERWLAGDLPDWRLLHGDRTPRRVHAPGYPFAEERYWLPAFRRSLDIAAAPSADREPGPEPVAHAPALAASAAPGAPAAPEMVALLVGELSDLLRIPAGRLAERTAFADIGVDSLVVHRLLERLEDRCGGVSAEAFFRYKTVGDLARYLGEVRAAAERAAARPAPDAPQAAAGPAFQPGASADAARYRPVPRDAAPRRAPGSGDIAVIGVSGRFPKAANLDEFWVNLEFARDCVVEIPRERWDHRDYGGAAGGGKEAGTYCRWGGFLADVDRFDAAFFRISPREAKFMDPQERLFLQTAAACLEDAGYSRARLRDERDPDGRAPVGVFVGATYNNYQLHQAEGFGPGSPAPVNSQTYSIANRVSYVFNLRGPSLCVDTACSSALSALHLACRSLADGESAMAIAGGVNLSLHPSKYVSLCAAQFASTDGHCRAFGADGDGYVPGEGVGAVLLKPLEQAEADGDHIHAVIKGTAMNNDGRTFGYSVPNPAAQAEVVRQALDRAGVDARTVSYVEAHGTGTKLGDPVEISGLTEAYARDTADRQYCAIGSVKSNIGHLEAAAGIAQLAKVLLQLRHRKLAASLIHADELNPAIDFSATPFRVQRMTADWERPVVEVAGRAATVPRRAGISSFGAGGVNVHVVVEEYAAGDGPALPPSGTDTGPVVVVLSAERTDRLREYARTLLTHLTAGAGREAAPADIAYTLQTGRDPHPYRLAFVAAGREEMVRGLELFLKDDAGASGIHLGTGQAPGPAPEEALGAEHEVPAALGSPTEMERAARLWAGGAEIDWEAYHRGRPPRRIPLPTYPFGGDRYWPTAPASRRAAPAVPAAPAADLAAAEAPPRQAAPAPACRERGRQAAEPAAGTGAAPPRPAADPAGPLPQLLAELVDAPPVEREDILSRFMLERLAELLDYPEGELPETRQGFFDMGMESVMVERFRNLLEQGLAVEVADTAVFDHPSAGALTEHLLGLVPWSDLESGTAQGPGGTAAAPATGTAAAPERDRGAHVPEPPVEQVAQELRALLVQLGDIRPSDQEGGRDGH